MRVKALLIERDEQSRDILLRHLCKQFPYIILSTAGSPQEALRSAQDSSYDLVICGEVVAQEPGVLCDICRGGGPLLIVLTEDTEITKERYPVHLRDACLFEVLHKPLDLRAVFHVVQLAIEAVKARRS